MIKILLSKLKESAVSILPISIVVIILTAIFVKDSFWSVFCFIFAVVFLIIGICLFGIGNDMSLMKIGGYIGSHLSKKRKIVIMLICSFVIGCIVTIAESDLSILASQVPSISSWIFIVAVGISVGFCMLLGIARILLNIDIRYVLLGGYAIVLVLMFFTSKQFLPIAFDASGVTTGAISVPFIMSFGLGISAVRSGENNQDDSFGLIAICSLGPIFAVMLLSVIFKDATLVEGTSRLVEYNSFASVANEFGYQILANLKDVAIILLPIILFFLLFNFTSLKLPKKSLLRIGVGTLYSYIGITLFFVGAKCGFLPVSKILAMSICSNGVWLLFPICAIAGLFIVIAEPAIHVLCKQVYDLSSGTISKKKMLITLSIGVSLSLVLSAVRIVTELNMLYFLCPLIVCMLVLSPFSEKKIVAIAFDSGGVAAGVMSSTFVLPFMQGICVSRGLNLMTYGFGTVGILILVPIIVVEIMGIKMKRDKQKYNKIMSLIDSQEKKIKIIEFD